MIKSNTIEYIAKSLGVNRSTVNSAARRLKFPVSYNEKGRRVFSGLQEKELRTVISENVLTEELKQKIRNLMSELLENTPAGYAVKLSDMKNFLISQHIKRDFCQYGCISLIAGSDFIIYDNDGFGGKTVIELSPSHEFVTEEANEQRMNELIPYYHKPKAKAG